MTTRALGTAWRGARTRERRVDVRGGLDRLDGAHRVVLVNLRAHLGEIDEDDVAQLLLRVVGDADGADVALDLDPLVVLRAEGVGAGSGAAGAPGQRQAARAIGGARLGELGRQQPTLLRQSAEATRTLGTHAEHVGAEDASAPTSAPTSHATLYEPLAGRRIYT